MPRKRPYKFIWPSSEQIDHLRPYVDELLDQIAEVSGQPGVRRALVTDLSSVGDFFYVPTSLVDKPSSRAWTVDEYHEAVREIAERLEVEIGPDDRLVDVARRMAGLA